MQMTYVLILPVGYDTETTKEFPMIVFTHGAGEVGTDGQRRVYGNGPAMELQQNHPFKETFPFIFLGPQCPPRGERWDQPQMFKAVSLIVDAAINSVPRRCRSCLLDRPQHGRQRVLARHDGRSRPVCRDVPMSREPTHPEAARKLRYVAVWMTAGDQDGDAVTHNKEMMGILQNNLAEVRNTVVPNVGHDVWPLLRQCAVL